MLKTIVSIDIRGSSWFMYLFVLTADTFSTNEFTNHHALGIAEKTLGTSDLVFETSTASLTLLGKDFNTFTGTSGNHIKVDTFAVGGALSWLSTGSSASLTDGGLVDTDTGGTQKVDVGWLFVASSLFVAHGGKGKSTTAGFAKTDNWVGDWDLVVIFATLLDALSIGSESGATTLGTNELTNDHGGGKAIQALLALDRVLQTATALLIFRGVEFYALANVNLGRAVGALGIGLAHGGTERGTTGMTNANIAIVLDGVSGDSGHKESQKRERMHF